MICQERLCFKIMGSKSLLGLEQLLNLALIQIIIEEHSAEFPVTELQY